MIAPINRIGTLNEQLELSGEGSIESKSRIENILKGCRIGTASILKGTVNIATDAAIWTTDKAAVALPLLAENTIEATVATGRGAMKGVLLGIFGRDHKWISKLIGSKKEPS